MAFDGSGGVMKAGEAKKEEKNQKGTGPLVWVVVVSKPGQERRARLCLEDQHREGVFGPDFRTYLPMKLAMTRKQDLVQAPFLPRYLFARIDLRLESWKRIWNTRGVHGLLASATAGKPYGVADWVIERIQAQEDAGYIRMGLPEERARAMGFDAGQTVRLVGSPLEALFVELVDEKRASILVSLLGRDSRLTVDIAKLRPTGGN